MTINSQTREDILDNIKYHLKLQTGKYKVFCEELNGCSYSMVLKSIDDKHCILANCGNINNPRAIVKIVSF